jgi:hypothetical protein
MKLFFAAVMVALPISITTSTWASQPGTRAESEQASGAAGQNPLAPPGTPTDPDSYTFRAYGNPPAPPDTPPEPKPHLSFGANLKQWMESLAPTGKTLSEQCKAIRAEAIKCLREAEAKEEWSYACKPHVDKYVKRCKQRRPKVNWLNPADPGGGNALLI